MNQLILADADIAVCSFDEKYVDTIVERRYEEKYREMTQIGYLSRFLRDWTCGMMTNKIFKKKIIGDIRFPEGHKIDDEFFTYKIVLKSEKVVVFSDVLYHYRMRKSSVMQSGIQYKECMLSDRIEYLTERYELVVKIYPIT